MELQCKPPLLPAAKPAAPASEAGSRPGSSLSGADTVKGKKGAVETGSLRKEPEKVKEVEKPKFEAKRNEDVNGDESPDRSIICRRQRSDSEDSTGNDQVVRLT